MPLVTPNPRNLEATGVRVLALMETALGLAGCRARQDTVLSLCVPRSLSVPCWPVHFVLRMGQDVTWEDHHIHLQLLTCSLSPEQDMK